MHRNGPRALSASVRIQFSVVVSMMLGRRPGVRNGPPATQASTATGPSCASTTSNSASTERSSTTSTSKAACPPPGSAPAARRASATFRSASATACPSRASARAVASPMPRPAPVTIATRFTEIPRLPARIIALDAARSTEFVVERRVCRH